MCGLHRDPGSSRHVPSEVRAEVSCSGQADAPCRIWCSESEAQGGAQAGRPLVHEYLRRLRALKWFTLLQRLEAHTPRSRIAALLFSYAAYGLVGVAAGLNASTITL